MVLKKIEGELMNRNVIIILLIFLVPLGVYFGLTRDKLTTPPSFASEGPEVIKLFYSQTCSNAISKTVLT